MFLRPFGSKRAELESSVFNGYFVFSLLTLQRYYFYFWPCKLLQVPANFCKIFPWKYEKYLVTLCHINIITMYMDKSIRSFGRSELAQQYFPKLSAMSAWRKFREWLDFNPRLRSLLSLSRRTYTPAEVQLIYAELGVP